MTRLGVLFAGHVHPFEELLDLVRRAEDLGYAAAWVDGDICMLDVRSDVDVLEGWTVTTALLMRTQRIQIGSLRVVHHWNAARLAQAVATAERLAPGRLRFFIAIGDRRSDPRFGMPNLSAGERVRCLDETLDAVRALWRGETVSRDGRYVALDGARVRPTPSRGSPQITVAAARPKMLEVVATPADVWDVNLPPSARLVGRATEQLDAACRARGRDPGEIARSMLLFTRLQSTPDPAALLREYRALNPWFRSVADAEITPGLVAGDAASCRARFAELAETLGLEHPIVDLTAADAATSRAVLAALAPGDPGI